VVHQTQTLRGRARRLPLKLRVSTKSSRNRQISGGSGVTAALRNGQNSGEFCYAQLQRRLPGAPMLFRAAQGEGHV
jgi:hypothetical protein